MKRACPCGANGARKVVCACARPPALCGSCRDTHRCALLATATPARSETAEIVRPLLDALHHLDVYAIRTQSGRVRVRNGWMHLAPEGTPDIQGFLFDGQGFVVETKLSHPDACGCSSCEAQRKTRVELERRNVLYVFARSVNEALIGLGLMQGRE